MLRQKEERCDSNEVCRKISIQTSVNNAAEIVKVHSPKGSRVNCDIARDTHANNQKSKYDNQK
jgi:hypothetical protein